jgi:outer membrane protein, multidrug efflux system
VRKLLFVLIVSAPLAACAARTAPPPSTLERTPLTRWDPVVFSAQDYAPLWWRQFDDPVLEEIEHDALEANRDVRSALARVDQARAVFDEDRRRRYPTVTAGAYVDVRDLAQPGFIDEPTRINTYRAALDASWELDLFGRVRAAVAAASANAESFEAALSSVRVSVAADVALNYFELRGVQQQLSVLDRSLANQRETLRLTQARRDAGIGGEQDVASAAARVSAIEAEVPPLRTALAVREHRLAVLTGRAPGQLHVNLAPRAYPVLAASIALGPPDHLLDRRPDVRAAERRLAATAAREGVATADLSAHHDFGRAWPACRARQYLRHQRFARVGGDPGAAVERVRPWQQPRAPARGACGHRGSARRLRTDDAAGAGGDGNRARHLPAAAGAPGQADRRSPRERQGGGHRAGPVP